MSFGFIPENRARCIRLEDFDNNFESNNVEDALKELKENSSSIDLSPYALKTDIPTVTNDLTDELKANYDKAYTHSQSKHFDGNYASLTNKPTIPTKTSQLTNDSKFLTAIPSEYVTETELNSKGYLTEHQSLIDYVKKSELSKVATSGSYNDLTNKPTIPSIEGLATEEYIKDMISFNENGELVVTIDGISKTFVPKTEVTE